MKRRTRILFTAGVLVILAFMEHRSVKAAPLEDDQSKRLVFYGCASSGVLDACKIYDPETGKHFVVVEHHGIGGTAIVPLE